MSQYFSPEDASSRDRHRSMVVFGEVLYDCFPDGRRVLGGAPFNVAWALQAFGEEPFFISAVGQDGEGDAISGRMTSWGMTNVGLQHRSDLETGIVDVRIENGEPSYEICSPRAWDSIRDEGFVADRMIYHGALALRSDSNQETLQSILERSSGHRFFDVNLRPPHTPLELVTDSIRGADWVKLNLDELRKLSGLDSTTLENSDEAIDQLIERYLLNNVLLTAGSDGAKIRGKYGEALLSPAPEPESMKDTVGAGDSFSAVMLHGILNEWDPETIIARAGRFAAKVCGLNGATSDDKEFYQL